MKRRVQRTFDSEGNRFYFLEFKLFGKWWKYPSITGLTSLRLSLMYDTERSSKDEQDTE